MGVTMQRPGPGVPAYAGAPSPLPANPAWPADPIQVNLSTRARPAAASNAGHLYVVESDAAQVPATQAVDDGVLELAKLCMGEDHEAARSHVEAYAARRSTQSVCLDLLAPAARYLGELWDEDLCSFTDVTIGLMRLQDALRGLTGQGSFQDTAAGNPGLHNEAGPGRRSIALATVPGDQHRFGLHMVAALFREAGWAVTVVPDSTLPDLGALLRREWFGVLGFSMGTGAWLDRLTPMLPHLRQVSRNRGLGILVGGPVFLENPQLAAQIGADGTATDGLAAITLAENLLAQGALRG